MDMNQYLDIFVEESKEHLQQLNSSLLQLEKNNTDKQVLNEIFRVAHTLKGMAGTMGYIKMQTLTHHMEDVLDALRNDKITVDSNMVDILFRCLDALETYVNTVSLSGQEGHEAFQDITDALAGILKGNNVQAKSTETSPKTEETGSTEPGKLRVELNQYDINVIKAGLDAGMNVFEIHIVLDKGCLLKAARAFIVFQVLDGNSEVIKSVPKIEDIEDERFDFEFTVVAITEKSSDFFIKEINSVAEIEKVEVTPIDRKSVV